MDHAGAVHHPVSRIADRLRPIGHVSRETSKAQLGGHLHANCGGPLSANCGDRCPLRRGLESQSTGNPPKNVRGSPIPGLSFDVSRETSAQRAPMQANSGNRGCGSLGSAPNRVLETKSPELAPTRRPRRRQVDVSRETSSPHAPRTTVPASPTDFFPQWAVNSGDPDELGGFVRPNGATLPDSPELASPAAPCAVFQPAQAPMFHVKHAQFARRGRIHGHHCCHFGRPEGTWRINPEKAPQENVSRGSPEAGRSAWGLEPSHCDRADMDVSRETFGDRSSHPPDVVTRGGGG